jgi:hypothetical protein
MNFSDNIEYLAQSNSGTCRPKREEEIDKRLPYFSLKKNETTGNGYTITAYNFDKHDNAPRMPYVLCYLRDKVFPFVKSDLSGYYNIQLHDTYTYLNDGIDYKDVLCFGKLKDEKGPVQMPDCYFLGNWGGKYESMKVNREYDTINWTDKMNKIVFAGTTTGSREPKMNERINTCLWARDKGMSMCDFYITSIAQIEPKRILEEVPDFKYIYRPPIPLHEQLKYRYQLVIDGNTCRWNPDVYFTNTLAFHWPSRDMLWYFPLLREGFEFVSVDRDSLINKFTYYENNQREAEYAINNAKMMANKLFNEDVCQKYTISLFENIGDNK